MPWAIGVRTVFASRAVIAQKAQFNDHMLARNCLEKGKADFCGPQSTRRRPRQSTGRGIVLAAVGEIRPARQLAQYAFSVRRLANGVWASMQRSSRSDQF